MGVVNGGSQHLLEFHKQRSNDNPIFFKNSKIIYIGKVVQIAKCLKKIKLDPTYFRNPYLSILGNINPKSIPF
jgi:hypothetical protein